MLSSLSTLFSDLPRLCCMVSADTQCSPEFTLFVSCNDMIQSRFYKFLAWIIGLMNSAVNVTCIFMLIVILCVQRYNRNQKDMQPLLVLMSFHITFCRYGCFRRSFFIVNLQCTLPRCVWHIYADVWKQSVACYSLELSVLVGNKCSLISLVYLTAASYIQITSLVKKTHSTKKNL